MVLQHDKCAKKPMMPLSHSSSLHYSHLKFCQLCVKLFCTTWLLRISQFCSGILFCTFSIVPYHFKNQLVLLITSRMLVFCLISSPFHLLTNSLTAFLNDQIEICPISCMQHYFFLLLFVLKHCQVYLAFVFTCSLSVYEPGVQSHCSLTVTIGIMSQANQQLVRSYITDV